jgi:hypothetical protein
MLGSMYYLILQLKEHQIDLLKMEDCYMPTYKVILREMLKAVSFYFFLAMGSGLDLTIANYNEIILETILPRQLWLDLGEKNGSVGGMLKQVLGLSWRKWRC